jgi:hydroxymethylglutaryl-CoA synthase
MSNLEADLQDGNDLTNAKIGFFAYGSGSKAKVFEGELQPQWKEMVSRFNLFGRLENRIEIDYDTYEALHRGKLEKPASKTVGTFVLQQIGNDPLLPGIRSYKWIAKIPSGASIKII